jgi:hypothetical protein
MYLFDSDSIKTKDGKIVMHSWETPVMEKMAEWVCSNGGDILEIGFGMGIASNFIQSHNINSHTICDNNPDVIKRLEEWSSDKPNVKIVKGDWHDNLDKFKNYDGILFDTFRDRNVTRFKKKILYTLTKNRTNVCMWDNMESSVHPNFKSSDVCKTEVLDVKVDKENSWNYVGGDKLYLHKIQINK